MLIGGLQKMTLIDYPGKVAATVFLVGCNFRCHFCHNPKLVVSRPGVEDSILHEDEVIDFLKSRKNLIEAVCVTGGEPTVQPDLAKFLLRLRQLGLLIKLDTNGARPEVIESLIGAGLLDYLAMDIKAPWAKYQAVTQKDISVDKLKQSVKLIIDSGLPHEFRSTVLPALHSLEDILEMAKQVRGAQAFYVQQFRPLEDLVDKNFSTESKYAWRDLEKILTQIKAWFPKAEVR